MADNRSAETLLDLSHIRKVFPNGTEALKGVSLAVRPGSVHGLVGANGAGKSTLIKIISGAIAPTSGEVAWRGSVVTWKSPAEASSAGISTIYQHIPLVPTLSVLDNVFLGRAGVFKQEARLRREFRSLLERLGYEVDATSPVSSLSIGQRQMVAIMQALARGASLVIMDEPTASLAQGEREIVFDVVRRLSKNDGTSFVYCSHFLDEVLDLTDRITVLRDGNDVVDEATENMTEERLVQAVVGRRLLQVERQHAEVSSEREAVLLQVDNLRSPGKVDHVTFSVNRGEVIGLAGLLGSGRTEILRALFGADSRASGSVLLNGNSVARSPDAAVRAGIAFVPEDRMTQGLIRDWPIWRNTSLPDVQRLSWRGIVPAPREERDRARHAITDLHIVAPDENVDVGSLSGGNAQKVVFAKWMYGTASVFLLDEPTVGVDVGTKADILNLIRSFAEQGKAVIMVSSEFEELLSVAHRILVVRQGRIFAERRARDTSELELVALASGLSGAGGVTA